MHRRIQIRYEIELLSDAIFGSGESIPGSVDLAVYKDQEGKPYFKATSMKGLLREAAVLLLSWKAADLSAVGEIFGEEGWNGSAGWRRLHLTDAKLINQTNGEYFGQRAFTGLENQVVKTGTLRSVECIKRGIHFEGECECAEADTELIRQAFANVKWIGGKRSRGFGSVKIHTSVSEPKKKEKQYRKSAPYLRYILQTQTPVIITDYARSGENAYETCGYITGSAVRGCLVGRIAETEPEWFEEHKKELLEQTIFFNALPKRGEMAVIPSIKGFYERKDGGEFQSVLKDGQLHGVVKRAGVGQYCCLNNGKICYWSAKTDGRTRIRRPEKASEDTLMFQNSCLTAGQRFEGYIEFPNSEIEKKISEYLGDTIWIGADRYEGFGKCSIEEQESVWQPEYWNAYGYDEKDRCSETLYLLAVSPLTMRDKFGENCGLELKELAERLQVSSLQVTLCSTAVSEYGGYNRIWRAELPLERMYDAGSIFKLECAEAPTAEALRKVQKEGLGIRKNEGYGQVLFLREEVFLGILGKKEADVEDEIRNMKAAEQRRNRCRWLLTHLDSGWAGNLSASQIGAIQSCCETGQIAGNAEKLTEYLKKNLEQRGIENRKRYMPASEFITNFLKEDQSIILGDADGGNVVKKLKLLCDLMDLGRKERER